ncbi:very long chain fatty acid elongase AAEL008004-like [Atheta coriaria]|uniref:very long chain fatty acid elongase AAEL008004-like n=1 Tax=Dalotia coriaria TaxID=877792 RepID=UPI0031F37068
MMNLWNGYHYIFDTYGDPRVKGWFLMSSPFPTIAISLIYAITVTKIGPKLMENRKPFQLRKTIIAYNFIQVLLSIFLFHEACVNGWLTFYSYTCQPVDFSNNPVALRTVRGCYLYFLSKFFEFLDTAFFVLKKNNHQISALHVIHHGIMPMSVWWGVKFFPGGNSTFFGFLNTFVHIIMYSYYLVAALGPQYKKYLWWKKYLTLLQMVQFTLVGIHAAQLLFIECDYPKVFVYLIFSHALMFLYLFSKFYDRSYKRDDKKPAVNGVDVSEKKSKHAVNNNTLTTMCFPGQDTLFDERANAKVK